MMVTVLLPRGMKPLYLVSNLRSRGGVSLVSKAIPIETFFQPESHGSIFISHIIVCFLFATMVHCLALQVHNRLALCTVQRDRSSGHEASTF